MSLLLEGFFYPGSMKKICLFFFVLALVGCKDELDQEREKQVIKSTLIDMWDAIEKADIDRYASYIHKDFTQFGEYDSILRSGKDAEVKSIKEWVENSTPISTKMHEPRVTIKGTTAFITYYWSDSGATNGRPFATKGKSTRIFVKEKGKWLCIHGHYTLLP